MPTIELSKSLKANSVGGPTLFYPVSRQYDGVSFQNQVGFYAVGGQIQIFEGAVPTDFNGLTTTVNTPTILVPQLLWVARAKDTNYATQNSFAPGNTGQQEGIIVNTLPRPILKTGVATWFRIASPYTNSSDYGYSDADTNPPGFHLIGTVGEFNSGADLQLSTTALQSGVLLGGTIILNVPGTYTW